MASIRTLKKQAVDTCKARGHKMGRFVTLDKRGIAQAVCKFCGMSVMVDTHPAPNSIDIAGNAVALNCSPEDKLS